jgi:hypothetical protein
MDVAGSPESLLQITDQNNLISHQMVVLHVTIRLFVGRWCSGANKLTLMQRTVFDARSDPCANCSIAQTLPPYTEISVCGLPKHYNAGVLVTAMLLLLLVLFFALFIDLQR